MKMTTKEIVLCGIFAALMCVTSVMTIPIGPVPISLGVLGIMLAANILGAKKGAVSVIVYILLGAAGLPVFSGFKGGVSVIAGPTGGYITSYILMALIIGITVQKVRGGKIKSVAAAFAANIAAVAVCYLVGTIQFVFVTNSAVSYALGVCVYPFIPFDIIKALIAALVGYAVRKRVHI